MGDANCLRIKGSRTSGQLSCVRNLVADPCDGVAGNQSHVNERIIINIADGKTTCTDRNVLSTAKHLNNDVDNCDRFHCRLAPYIKKTYYKHRKIIIYKLARRTY